MSVQKLVIATALEDLGKLADRSPDEIVHDLFSSRMKEWVSYLDGSGPPPESGSGSKAPTRNQTSAKTYPRDPVMPNPTPGPDERVGGGVIAQAIGCHSGNLRRWKNKNWLDGSSEEGWLWGHFMEHYDEIRTSYLRTMKNKARDQALSGNSATQTLSKGNFDE